MSQNLKVVIDFKWMKAQWWNGSQSYTAQKLIES